MAVSVTLQCYVFLTMCIIGAVIGIAFDILRILRGYIKSNVLITALTDALFWIFVTFVVLYAVFIVNSGEIRWFEFVGLALGGIIYFNTISRFLVKTIRGIIGFVTKALKRIFMFFIRKKAKNK